MVYLVNVQTMRKIAQNFVAFSEYMNFSSLVNYLVHVDDKITYTKSCIVKFSFFEKATKICAIVLVVLTFAK